MKGTMALDRGRQGRISLPSLPILARWALRWSFRLLTSPARGLADFCIIGAQRCGTTSLYNYLAEHPGVAPAFVKETHFFDTHYAKGLLWYRAYFPFVQNPESKIQNPISGESTPYYLFYPHAPERLRRAIPGARLIVLLRNPVDRAFSHYHHEVSMGAEKASFEEALIREQAVLPGEATRVQQDGRYRSFAHNHYSYLARGIYVDQLQRWAAAFPRAQILILKSEDLGLDPGSTLRRVTQFLGLPDWTPGRYPKYNLARYSDMDPATRQRLTGHFAPHNQRLYEFLGQDLGWD
jgi:hypothetical protein